MVSCGDGDGEASDFGPSSLVSSWIFGAGQGEKHRVITRSLHHNQPTKPSTQHATCHVRKKLKSSSGRSSVRARYQYRSPILSNPNQLFTEVCAPGWRIWILPLAFVACLPPGRSGLSAAAAVSESSSYSPSQQSPLRLSQVVEERLARRCAGS